MKKILCVLVLLYCGLLTSGLQAQSVTMEGELKCWHRLTLIVEGPQSSEDAAYNPFLNYRLDVTFTQGDKSYTVPGYFAVDGNAANSSATAGNIWKVHFAPDSPGQWQYEVSFRKGKAVAVKDIDGQAIEPDGYTGKFTVLESDKKVPDFRARGRLDYVGQRYLRFAGSGDYFLKAGADSPENFLAYKDFDGTYYGGYRPYRIKKEGQGIHAYQPHLKDWKQGDPVWQKDKGKSIIGALNYLSSKGMNSVYFLTMNVLGDGDDVWPWTDRNERYRFDCSKLDQWEIVFSHMDSLGLMLHVVLQETENECVLDAGYLDIQRKLYLRELVARFAHHLAITWNLGEEHGRVSWSPYGQTTKDTKAMADYLKQIDPYKHFVVVHTHSYEPDRHDIMAPLLGHPAIEGPSVQVDKPEDSHEQTLKWLALSKDSVHQWVVCLDEIGIAWKGAMPDKDDPEHDTIRHLTLWGNLMAGGAGVEWYFGYRFPNNDLNCEDWRSRDKLWEQSFRAIDFFYKYLPFNEMKNHNELTASETDYCLAKAGEVYAIYIPKGACSMITLPQNARGYTVDWYNPRSGGELQKGSLKTVEAGLRVFTGYAPGDHQKDWLCLIRKK